MIVYEITVFDTYELRPDRIVVPRDPPKPRDEGCVERWRPDESSGPRG